MEVSAAKGFEHAHADEEVTEARRSKAEANRRNARRSTGPAMTRQAKARANRLNARRSTGPKSSIGKLRSSFNACKHGLLSRVGVLVPGERSADYRDFEAALRADLAPQGELEALLVDRIVTCAWRLRRLLRVEAGVFAVGHHEQVMEKATRVARLALDPGHEMPVGVSVELEQLDEADEQEAGCDTPEPGTPAAYRAQVLREQRAECFGALDQRTGAANALHRQPALSGRAFIQEAANADTFTKLARYEAAIERGMYRALHELQRLQAARTGEPVTLPVAVDVVVSGAPEEGR